MSDKRDLSELLTEALDSISEIGSADRARLADLVGREIYDGLIAKPRTADLIDRWENASAKTKPAAVKALSIAIAKQANKAGLVGRIEKEITDTFDDGAEVKHHAAVNQRRNGKRAYEKPKSVDLALLAKSSDLSKYMKARQNSRH